MTEQTAAPATGPEPEAPASAPVPPRLPDLPPVPPMPPAPVVQGARPPRRVLRAVARWTAAVLVFGAAGAGTAYGITEMERTDVPGLATEDDGRWDYPALALPALPADKPRPYSDGNPSEIHHADLRELLLPAPAGVKVDKKLKGAGSAPSSSPPSSPRAGAPVSARPCARAPQAHRGARLDHARRHVEPDLPAPVQLGG